MEIQRVQSQQSFGSIAQVGDGVRQAIQKRIKPNEIDEFTQLCKKQASNHRVNINIDLADGAKSDRLHIRLYDAKPYSSSYPYNDEIKDFSESWFYSFRSPFKFIKKCFERADKMADKLEEKSAQYEKIKEILG